MKPKRLMTYWPYIMFFAAMLLQHSYIFLYHDDFGYASLSYLSAFTENVQGREYTFSQLVDFLYVHYLTVAGRILPFFLLLSVLRWNIWVFRIIQSVVLTVISFSMNTIAEIEFPLDKRFLYNGIIACAFYGLISVDLHQNGTYWASASILYVWPFLWILLAGIIHKGIIDHQKDIKWCILSGILFFASGFSQEQVAFTAFFMLIGFLVTHIVNHRGWNIIKLDLVNLLMFIMGFILLVSAPGLSVRKSYEIYSEFYSLNLLEKIRWNLPSLLQIDFGNQNLLILVFWTLVNAIFLWKISRTREKNRKVTLFFATVQIFYLTLFVLMLICENFKNILFFERVLFFYKINFQNSFIFWGLFITFASLIILFFSIQNGSYVLFGLYFGGIVSQLSMLFLPTVNMRMGLIFIFSLIPVIISIFTWSLNSMRYKFIKFLLLAILLLAAIMNMGSIINGYKGNNSNQLINNNSLIEAAKAYEQGKELTKIILERLPNDRYAGAMPYMPGYNYIDWWIKEYYKLPPNAEIYWKVSKNNQNLELKIIDYSSVDSLVVGKLINLHQNGQSTFWLITENATPTTVIVFNERILATTFGSPELLTAFLPENYFLQSGNVKLYIYDTVTKQKSISVQITIEDQ